MVNKLIIFDLDGVLIDSREIHYESLNLSLERLDKKYTISREEHLSLYDGLPTSQKLKILTEKRGLPVEKYEEIWRNKQDETLKIFSSLNTVIFEDSHIGRQGAIDSGASLVAVENRDDLTEEKIDDAIKILSDPQPINIPWRSEKMNILVPMAGGGSRFASAGYTFPKPLVEINGKPMIQTVVENLNIEANYIFIVQKEHYEKYNLQYLLKLIKANCKIIQVDGITEGAACTTLLAKEFINNDEPLITANSDQFVEWNSNECLYAFNADGIDGGILTFEATHPKWSFAKIGEDGFVSEVAEKKPISNNATVGIYFWKRGCDYVKYCEQMIEKDIRINGEFYVCPVFNEAINDGKKIRAKKIDKMWGLGTPEDLNYFLEHYEP